MSKLLIELEKVKADAEWMRDLLRNIKTCADNNNETGMKHYINEIPVGIYAKH